MAGSEEALLTVEDLNTVFHTDKETIRAVDGISFTVREGETVGIVGESGSGKSVTARSILGLIESPGVIESGSIRFRGDELTDDNWDRHRGDVAIVFQDPINSMNPVYTVGNQIREALRIHQGLRGQAAREEAVRLLEEVGIPDAPRRVDEYPHQFSGGMRQRAVIAMALACDPDLLVCDEPTTALDVTIQAQILELLEELQAEEDLSILFITHDMGVIEEATDRVNVMYAGEIVETAPADELFANPQHPYTRGLLASIPGRTGRGDRLPTIEGEVPTPTEQATHCRFAPRCPEAFGACESVHPEHVAVGDEHTAACLLHDDRYDAEYSADGPTGQRDGDAAVSGGEGL
ncbi:ABC transporter ATP-binding protein [Halobaculum sp. D14]|uniref:ABC transporter ATP-binding protein n=1 Tax=unclassified Halobaculum TaxID=2640896 RepID=UPI003EB8FB52